MAATYFGNDIYIQETADGEYRITHKPTNQSLTLGADGLVAEDVNTDTAHLQDTASDPSNDGEIRQNNGDVKVYSGGVVRNLTNIADEALEDLQNASEGLDAERPQADGSNGWYFSTDGGIYYDNGSWQTIAIAPGEIGASDLTFDPVTESELTSHTGNSSAHHTKTDPGSIQPADLPFDPVTQNELGAHAGDSSAHHSKTTDSSDLSDVSPDSNASAHHSKTTDSSDLSDVSPDSDSSAHHSKTSASDLENGGSDELNVGGLSGDLADAQDPKTHDHSGDAIAPNSVDAGEVFSNTTTIEDPDGTPRMSWTTVEQHGVDDGRVVYPTNESAGPSIHPIIAHGNKIIPGIMTSVDSAGTGSQGFTNEWFKVNGADILSENDDTGGRIIWQSEDGGGHVFGTDSGSGYNQHRFEIVGNADGSSHARFKNLDFLHIRNKVQHGANAEAEIYTGSSTTNIGRTDGGTLAFKTQSGGGAIENGSTNLSILSDATLFNKPLDLRGNEIRGDKQTSRVQMDDFINVQPRTSAPSTPTNGDIVYANGTGWDPGSGAGGYIREEGAWVKL